MPWKCFKVEQLEGEWEDSPGGGRVKHQRYRLLDGRELKEPDVPPGAVLLLSPDAPWAKSYAAQPGSDGMVAFVKLPSGVWWCTTGHASHGGYPWTRTGNVPDTINVMPSINYQGTYHGWVQNGYVTDDVEGRKFDDVGKLIQGAP